MVAVEEVSKSLLRKYALSLRKTISNKDEKDNIIKNKIINNINIKNSTNILIYVSKNDEVNTKKLINELLKLNKKIFVPKVENDIINFYQINNLDDLTLGHFNILEPITKTKYKYQKNTCIIVPGLLFDKNNNRLGYGGGYYDKFLQNKNIYKIGICYSKMIINKIITEKTDIKMDEIITEV